jgi:hypothetical protein
MKPSLQRRGTRLVLWAAALTAAASAVMGSSMATAATRSHDIPNVVPSATVVGRGLVDCKTVTGEVGYSPNSVHGGQGPLTVSIWFRGSNCHAFPGTATKPVPKWVIGSMSFVTQNGCPLSGTLGAGTLNLAYDYPDVAPLLIDPSVAPKVTVNPFGPFWILQGPITAGSYTDPKFRLLIKPDIFAGHTCAAPGLISEYIARSQGDLVV